MSQTVQTSVMVLSHILQVVVYSLIGAVYGMGVIGDLGGAVAGAIAGGVFAITLVVFLKRIFQWHQTMVIKGEGQRGLIEKAIVDQKIWATGVTDIILFNYILLILIMIEAIFVHYLYVISFNSLMGTKSVYVSSIMSIFYCVDYASAYRSELCTYNLIVLYIFIKSSFFILLLSKIQKRHIDVISNNYKIRIGIYGGIAISLSLIIFAVVAEGVIFYSNIDGYEYDAFNGGDLILLYIPLLFCVLFSVVALYLVQRARAPILF